MLSVRAGICAHILAVKDRYDVHMTRASDVLVSPDRRLAVSGRSGASLFISIDADSIGVKEHARGACGYYTLSELASSRQAQLLADKENASDILAGAESGGEEETDQVREHPHRPDAGARPQFLGGEPQVAA